ncbi:MAG TPA: hypothetical protein VM286_09690 [Candidatus Thermoplasmatota archaeon]|nr:hypothetical protein [Candidatus Thermoplasmatota archaeon]
MSDDDLSQREKRMQRHKQTVRKDLPKTVAKTYGIWLLVLLVLGAAGYAIYKSSTNDEECPGHWHATFNVFVPGPDGQPKKVDMSTPVASNGAHYYDLSGGAGMGYDVHMHQSGPEAGALDARPAQLHFEPVDNSCVSVKSALHAVEIDADASTLKLFGGHQQVQQDHTWTANGTAGLHYYLEAKDGGNWTWSERSWDSLKGHQMQDGESLLVVFGNYPEATVRQLQAQVPDPMSRA